MRNKAGQHYLYAGRLLGYGSGSCPYPPFWERCIASLSPWKYQAMELVLDSLSAICGGRYTCWQGNHEVILRDPRGA